MKKLLLLLLIVPVVSFGQIMTFDKTVHDFGRIMEGDVVMTTFKFTNTGDTSLYIVDARGSYGTTVLKYPKNTPIGPGETGKILVSFDSNNKPDLQQKTVTISANTTSGRETLRIKALVNPDPRKQKQRRDVSSQNQRQSRDAAADGHLRYKVGNDTYTLPKEEVTGFLNEFPNAVPYYESKEKSGQVQTFESQSLTVSEILKFYKSRCPLKIDSVTELINVNYTNIFFVYNYKLNWNAIDLKSKITNAKSNLDAWVSGKINSDNEYLIIRKTGRDVVINYMDMNRKPVLSIAYSVNRNGKYERNKGLEKKFEEIAKRRGGF